MPNIKRLDKLPKRKVTVSQLLETEEINSTLNDFYECAQEADEFIGICCKDNRINWTYNASLSRQLWLLERVKYCILQEASGESEVE